MTTTLSRATRDIVQAVTGQDIGHENAEEIKRLFKKFGWTPPGKQQAAINAANKSIDAMLEWERVANEKIERNEAWKYREEFPEPIRDLLDVYVKLTGQRATKSKLSDWLMTGQEWLDAGIQAVDLEKAYKKSKDGTGFTVARPGSLTNTAAAMAGERRTGKMEAVSKEHKPFRFDD